MSEPVQPPRPTTFEGAPLPSGSRPPRSATRRATTGRPDTGASGIGELPDQQFFPEGEEFDEEDEFDEEEEPDGKGVFAFARPATAAPQGGRLGYASSDYGTTAPNTGIHPTTAGTFASGATFGIGTPPTIAFSDVPTPTGIMDVGGNLPQLEYDPSHPPPLSGRDNLNNSSFAFMNKLQNETLAAKGKGRTEPRPATGRSLLDRLQRRNLTTAGTAMTGTTQMTMTTDMSRRTSEDSHTESEAGSFTTDGTVASKRKQTKRMRSSAPLITGNGDGASEAGTRRGLSRGSYGMTEISGDMTVPDGKTTWGDGMGGIKEGESEIGSLAGVEMDLAEEDSPYPEVRASVSNLDDPEMPGELMA